MSVPKHFPEASATADRQQDSLPGRPQRRSAIVTGCSWIGAEMACRLSVAGYPVIVVDNDKAALARLPGTFGGIILEADPTDPAVLEQCHIREASLLMSLFIDDAVNILIGKIAETIYHVPDIRIMILDGSHRATLTGSAIQVISPSESLSTLIMADLKNKEANP